MYQILTLKPIIIYTNEKVVLKKKKRNKEKTEHLIYIQYTDCDTLHSKVENQIHEEIEDSIYIKTKHKTGIFGTLIPAIKNILFNFQ